MKVVYILTVCISLAAFIAIAIRKPESISAPHKVCLFVLYVIYAFGVTQLFTLKIS